MFYFKRFIDNHYFSFLFFCLLTLFFTYPLLFDINKYFDRNRDDPEFTIIQNHEWDGKLFTDRLDYAKEKILSYDKFYIVDYMSIGYLYVIQGLIIMFFFGVSSITAHNLLFVISVLLSGFFMYLLAFELTKNRLGSLLSGFFFATTNYLFAEFIIGHGVLFQLQWLPLFFLFLERLISKPKIKTSLLLGLSLSFIILSSPYYTIYLTIIAPIYCFSRSITFFKNKRLVSLIILSIIVSLCLSSFYLVERFNVDTTIRTIEENLTDRWRLTSFWELVKPTSASFFIGQIPLLLSFWGVYYILKKKDRKMFPFILIFLVSIVLSIGPIWKFAPYTIIYQIWPFINKFRTPYRIFPFALMSIALFLSFFFKEFTKKNNFSKQLILLLIILALIVIFNHLPSIYVLSLRAVS